jgi:alpha-1,3/alpha-1,6-mannosyltransferase
MDNKFRITFIHPNLGIGGAEQLVVNLALALQRKGNSVKIFTSFHDKNHCFPETRDGTLEVESITQRIPFTLFNRFFLLMSTIKLILVTLWAIFFGGRFDVYIVDQNSNILPLLWLFRKKTIFYLHYPDKLLCQNREGFLKKAYRFVMDFSEEFSLSFATKILVNSVYTMGIYKESFKVLEYFNKQPEVLYPAIDFRNFPKLDPSRSKMVLEKVLPKDKRFFLSLNRYERKKNVGLAIQSFAEFKKKMPSEDCALVIAGGYDTNVRENVDYEIELKLLANQLGIQNEVIFLRSIDHESRLSLLENCVCVCYTPQNEHFGIVPIEVMYMGRPVICHNSGGPKESVGKDCGFLLSEDPRLWAEKLEFLYKNPAVTKKMGETARENVISLFSFNQFTEQSHRIVYEVVVPSIKQKNN